MKIRDMTEELGRRKDAALDIIADSRSLVVRPENEDLVLNVPDQGAFPLTEWAHGQLADKCGIPKRYYDRMRSEGRLELAAENVNAWIGEKDRRLVRILDGRVRALLSDRYRVIDTYDLTFQALTVFRRLESVRIHRAILTENMMYIKAVDLRLTAEIHENDILCGGVVLRNSEVGTSSFRVEPFILRKVCTNGLIATHVLKQIHVGKQTIELGEIDWSDTTRELEDQTLFAKVQDLIEATFDPATFDGWVDTLENSAEMPIEKPIEAVNNVAKMGNLTEKQMDQMLLHFEEASVYGLVNAITHTARDSSSVDEQIRLEELGGRVLTQEVGR